MNAQTSIDSSPTAIRESLMRARDIALRNRATMQEGATRDLNSIMGLLANDFANNPEVPAEVLHDALLLCRLLMRAQNMSGMLDGTYPTDRYDTNEIRDAG